MLFPGKAHLKIDSARRVDFDFLYLLGRSFLLNAAGMDACCRRYIAIAPGVVA